MTDIFREVRDLASALSDFFFKKGTGEKAIVQETKPAPVEEEKNSPYATGPWVKLVKSSAVPRSICFKSLKEDLPSQWLFDVDPSDSLHESVANYIKSIKEEEPITPQILKDWTSMFDPSYEASLLWLTMYRYDNEFRLKNYFTQLSYLNKRSIVCKFSELQDQGRTLN